jgi:hypothetical protein
MRRSENASFAAVILEQRIAACPCEEDCGPEAFRSRILRHGARSKRPSTSYQCEEISPRARSMLAGSVGRGAMKRFQQQLE